MPRSPARSLTKLFYLLIPVLLWLSLREVSWSIVFDTLSGFGVVQILALLLVNILIVFIISARLWILLRAQGHKVPLRAAARYWLVEFAVSYLTPGPQFGGEPVKIYYLNRRHHVPLPDATASVVTSKVLERVGNATFLLFGLFILLRLQIFSPQTDRWLTLFGWLLLTVPLLYLIAVRLGSKPVTALLSRAPARWLRKAAFQKSFQFVVEAEAQMVGFCREHLFALTLGLALTLGSWIFILLESWLALYFLGTPFSPAELIGLVAAAQASFLTPFPGGLGAFESAVILVTDRLGYLPALGASLAILVRMRDLLFGGIGLWQGGWMAFRAREQAEALKYGSGQKTWSFYDRIAPVYDLVSRLTAFIDGVDPVEERSRLIQNLDLQPGQRVLEVAVGTGINLDLIGDRPDNQVELFGLDVSMAMLHRSTAKLGRTWRPFYLVAANAAHLPFAGASFDVVFHFGGINNFDRRALAIEEMMRATRPGGTILVSDKSLIYKKDASLRYRLLAKLKPQLLQPPPLDLIPLPEGAVQLTWFWKQAAYMLKFKAPKV